MLSALRRFFVILILPLFLVACGEDEELAKRNAELEAYTITELRQMFDDGDFAKALEVLQHRRRKGIVSEEHYLLAADIFVALSDGAAAEATILQLLDRGVSPERTALAYARSLIIQRKPEEADAVFEDITLSDEDVYEGLILRGDIKLALREYEAAEEFYTAAIEANPDDYNAYIALALYYLQSGNIADARRYVEEAAARQSDDPIVSYAQGMVARYDARIDEAVEFFLAAVEANPLDVLSRLELIGIYISQDKFAEAQLALDAVYASSPDHPMAGYYSALLMLKEGNYDAAEDILIRTGSFARGYPLAAQVYGFVTYELGKYTTAIPYLQRALQFFPNDVDIRLALADSYGRRSRATEAMNTLRPLLAQGGVESVETYIHATAAASGLGDIRAARGFIEKALELAKQDETIDKEVLKALQRQTAFARALDDDLDGAAALLDALYVEDSDDVDSLTRRANLHLIEGDYEAARTALNQLKSFEPDSPVTNNFEGALLHRERKFEEAIVAYTRAIDVSPEYQSALKNRAFSYIQMEDYEKARKDIEVLNELTKPDPQMLAMYGRTLVETGEPEAALEILDQAAAVLPKFFIVYADRAEALADLGYFNRAISDLEQAKSMNAGDEDFAVFANGRQAEFRERRAEQEEAEEQARQARLAELENLRQAQQEKEDARNNDEDSNARDEEQAAILSELRKLAEENRKLDELESEEEAEYQPLIDELSPEQLAQEEREQALRDIRNQLFGEWLTTELDLSGSEAERYIERLLRADRSEPGDTDIIRKAISDLEDAGKRATIQSIEQKIAEKMSEAQVVYEERQQQD